ncbi:MAG: hypothetical protein JWN46_1206 [Acidimicrobiales bacterium]|nr:hypothetical protein [Acidimicrobiales bacterium]
MTTHCVKHSFELSVGNCRKCNNGFCARCLLFPFGEKKPGFCVACALAASGVRNSAGARPAAVAPKESRQEIKARKRAEKDARKNNGTAPELAPAQEPGVIPSPFEPGGIRFPTPH